MLPKLAPIAALYHENSKLTASSVPTLLESIQTFASDDDTVRRSMAGHKVYATSHRIDLRDVKHSRLPNAQLFDVLKKRRTVRRFSAKSIEFEAAASLLETGCGVTANLSTPDFPDITQPVRSYPSGGALYPVETYLAATRVSGITPGIYHYNPVNHCLEHVSEVDPAAALAGAVLTEDPSSSPAGALLLTVRWDHVLHKYSERGYRIALLEAGHLAQNLLLAGTALKLAMCPVAGFNDDALAALLDIAPADESVIYVILIGR